MRSRGKYRGANLAVELSRLTDVESVKKSAMVNGDSALGTVSEAKGGGKDVSYFVGSGMKMDGCHSRVRIWSQRLRWRIVDDGKGRRGDVPAWNTHVEDEPRRSGDCVV